MNHRPVAACWRVEDLPTPLIAEARQIRCEFCFRPCWLAPTSEWILKGGGTVACLQCVAEHVKNGDAILMGWAKDHAPAKT